MPSRLGRKVDQLIQLQNITSRAERRHRSALNVYAAFMLAVSIWPIVRHYHLASGRPRPEEPGLPGIRVPHRLPDPPKTSAAALWAPLARFIAAEARIGHWAEQRPSTAFAYEFVRFGLKQGWACLFGGVMVALIVGTHLWYPRGAALARYDFLFLAAVAIQVAMLTFKLETLEEAKVILLFHVVGTIMEVFKTGGRLLDLS